jgi:hypothetical protein
LQDEAQREGAHARRLRLEAEWGDGKVVDPCDDRGFWTEGGATADLLPADLRESP